MDGLTKVGLCLVISWIGLKSYAQEEATPPPTPNTNQEAPDVGYDESFKTGDIPKPNDPDLDPDLAKDEEVAPDRNPDENPDNSLARDFEPQAFRFGLSAALTFPHLINLGVETLIWQRFGISLNYGNGTRNYNDVDVGIRHTDLRIRWMPWAESFFVGVAFGQHQISGELDRNISVTVSGKKTTVPTHGKLMAKANYVVPHLGWFSVWDNGFLLGFDVGYLVPQKVTSSFESSFSNVPSGVSNSTLEDSNEYKEMKRDLVDSSEKFAGLKTPFSSLFRIGWMF